MEGDLPALPATGGDHRVQLRRPGRDLRGHAVRRRLSLGGTAEHRPESSGAEEACGFQRICARVRGTAERVSDPDVVTLDVDGSVSADLHGAAWLHLHSLALTELALDLRCRLGAKLVYTVHTQPWLELTGHPRRRFWLDMQARLLGACDRVIFLSAAERTSAETLFPHLPPVHV